MRVEHGAWSLERLGGASVASRRIDETGQHPSQLGGSGLESPLSQQVPVVGSLEPVFNLSQRRAGDNEESALVRFSFATESLGDVRADRVRGPDQLNPDGPHFEGGPIEHEVIEVVREGCSELVGNEVSMTASLHCLNHPACRSCAPW